MIPVNLFLTEILLVEIVSRKWPKVMPRGVTIRARGKMNSLCRLNLFEDNFVHEAGDAEAAGEAR